MNVFSSLTNSWSYSACAEGIEFNLIGRNNVSCREESASESRAHRKAEHSGKPSAAEKGSSFPDTKRSNSTPQKTSQYSNFAQHHTLVISSLAAHLGPPRPSGNLVARNCLEEHVELFRLCSHRLYGFNKPPCLQLFVDFV